MPISDVSTSTTKDFVGSGCLRIGAVVKAVLHFWKAFSASEFQDNFLVPFYTSAVSGVAIELNPRIKLQ